MYPLQGDLNQVREQKHYLETECAGFSFHNEFVIIPSLLTQEEYQRAVFCFWLDKPAGWWNYKEDFIRIGCCTAEQFQEALVKQRDKHAKEMELADKILESPPLLTIQEAEQMLSKAQKAPDRDHEGEEIVGGEF